VNQNTVDMISKMRKWLRDSSEILSSIETESLPTTRQVGQVALEEAGCLSLL